MQVSKPPPGWTGSEHEFDTEGRPLSWDPARAAYVPVVTVAGLPWFGLWAVMVVALVVGVTLGVLLGDFLWTVWLVHVSAGG